MGRRGPVPTPSSILRQRGTLRGDRVFNEPEPPGGVPEPPEWLSGEARQAWEQLAPDLEASRLLTCLDANALGRYCTLWARWRAAEDFIATHGSVYTLKDASGQAWCVMQFPQVAIAHRLSLALTKLEAEFGMTPSPTSWRILSKCFLQNPPILHISDGGEHRGATSGHQPRLKRRSMRRQH